MSLIAWRKSAGRRVQGRGRGYARPSVEALENRVTPATFAVNTFADTMAANLTTGRDASGHVSLRSALQAADHLGGSNAITLPAGTYRLTLERAVGELAVSNNLTLSGSGTVVIDAGGLGRAFEVLAGYAVSLSGVTVQGGVAAQGGGVYNAGALTLTKVTLTGDTASGPNGVAGAAGGDGLGGAVYNAAGATLSLVSCTLSNDRAVGGNGGNGAAGTSGAAGLAGANGSSGFYGSNGSAGGNGGAGTDGGNGGAGGNGLGGAVYNAGGMVTIATSTITGNRATGGVGGDGGAGGSGGDGGSGGSASSGIFGGGAFGGGGGAGGAGGQGGAGGAGGQGAGAGVYSAGDALTLTNSTLANDLAAGGTGGNGAGAGSGGSGGGGGSGADGYPGGWGGSPGSSGTAGAGGAGGAGLGGGLCSTATAVTVTGCTFSGDATSGGAAGVGGNGGNGGNGGWAGGGGGFPYPVGGRAGGWGGAGGQGGAAQGGGLYATSGNISVVDCTFAANRATAGLGALGGNGGNGGSSSGFFNYGPGVGGGSGGAGGGGGAGAGGAVHNGGATLLLASCTVAGNQAVGNSGGSGGNGGKGGFAIGGTGSAGSAGSGGAASLGLAGGVDAASGTTQLHNALIAKNTDAAGSPDAAGAFTDLGHNLLGVLGAAAGFAAKSGDLLGTSAKPIDPKLGPLQKNAGPTPTMALLTGSPALDAGDNNGAPALDQQGLPRMVNGAADIGAFEAGTAPQRFIALAYEDLFGRAVDKATSDKWSAKLAAGASPVPLLQWLTIDSEHFQAVVRQVYQAYLGQAPDAATLQSAAALQRGGGGAALDQLRAKVLGSSAYYQGHGGTDAGFLAALAQDVFGRPIKAAELTGWAAQLRSGTSRSALALQELRTAEGRRHQVQALYLQYLRRAVDPGALSACTTLLQQGSSQEAVILMLVESHEYYRLATGT